MTHISFEFFPPKNPSSDAALFEALAQLFPFKPEFCSVTYGAGGSTQARTADIVKKIQKNFNIPTASHLTCVNASKTHINQIAQHYYTTGIRRIVALRGDLPGMKDPYTPHPDGYAYAHELVSGLKEIGDFDISVACFPETHPEATSSEADIDYLKRKIDAGANRAIMQYCFDTDIILRFIDKIHAKGVTIPLVPGIMPIQNIEQTISFSKRCGATIPDWLKQRFEGTEGNEQASRDVAADIAYQQCEKLLNAGIDALHIYTLNKVEPTVTICDKIIQRD